LNRLAAYIEKNQKLKNKVVGAMWYPAGVMVVAAIVIAALLTFVIPKFEAIFASVGQELPAPTQVVINLSHFLKGNFHWVIIGIVATIVAFAKYYATEKGRSNIDGIIIQTPIFGTLIQKTAIARFSRTMSTMLSSGVGIIEALEICANVVGNAVVERAIGRAKIAITEGKSITQPLSKEPFIPNMVTQMIGIGEATGTLDTMLGKIADFYEEEVDYAVDALTSIMEPLMMVFLGGIIAALVIAMYLPIFSLAGTVGG
jgi:type IV pilus assembly protein PilC